jgi:antitoxin VapB
VTVALLGANRFERCIDVDEVAALGVEVARAFDDLLAVIVIGVGDRGEELGVAPGTADVLGWPGAATSDAPWVCRRRLERHDVLDVDPVLPAVAEVVEVDEAAAVRRSLEGYLCIYTSGMALSIKNPEADRLARELADTTGENLTEAVMNALQERLERAQRQRAAGVAQRLRRLAAEVQEIPVIDRRHAEDIIGYDDDGLPR